ncbi:MAG: PilZ domain-containing protein [Elusimicrobiota bacterium]|jgi:hypothetical protein
MAETDRRRHHRYDQEVSVQLRGQNPCSVLHVIDISMGGLGFQLSEPLKVGQKIAFRMDLPAGPVDGVAVVRWLAPHHLGWRCGVELRDPGYLARRRMRLFLEPWSFNALRVFDRLLIVLAPTILALAILDSVFSR